MHTHMLHQADVTAQAQQRVSSILTSPHSLSEGNVPIPAQQRDISIPTPQIPSRPEENVTTPAQQQENSVLTTPNHAEGNVCAHTTTT